MTEINQEKRDRKYNNWARYYPAIVNLTFPLVLVAYLFFDMDVVKSANSDLLKTIELLTKIILVFGCVISALFFFYAVFMRELSINLIEKVIDYIFEKYSVKIMLKKNKTFSDDRKKTIKEQINKKYDIDIPDSENEPHWYSRDKDYRKKVNEAYELIKEDTRNSAILFEYNCFYGFFRNLSGGLFFNFIILIIIRWSGTPFFDTVSDLLKIYFIVILTLFILCLWFIRTSDKTYAKRLYVVFLSNNKSQTNKNNE